jgi:hypothetical protein
MKSSWQTETGHLACRWSEAGQHVQYDPRLIQETTYPQGSDLPPVPDFASHRPLGGAFWFQPGSFEQDLQ